MQARSPDAGPLRPQSGTPLTTPNTPGQVCPIGIIRQVIAVPGKPCRAARRTPGYRPRDSNQACIGDLASEQTMNCGNGMASRSSLIDVLSGCVPLNRGRRVDIVTIFREKDSGRRLLWTAGGIRSALSWAGRHHRFFQRFRRRKAPDRRSIAGANMDPERLRKRTNAS
jgi:hypothetical protein